MPRHRRAVSRPVLWSLRSVIFVPVAIAALFAAPAAGNENVSGHNPDNVLVMRKGAGGVFGRWVSTPAAAAARTTQRTQRVRARKAKTAVPVEQPAPAAPQAAKQAWPSAAATAGNATLVPVTVRTVREMVEPNPESSLVFENELSDIDLAARPVRAAAPAATDGRAFAEADAATEQPRIFAMTETVKSIAQSAWIEPVLLVLAGALAAVSALRLFA